MPGYQRFVTYMFRYENGKKMENCGFAKVEVRQQECRIQIQLKGITADKTEVYLLNDNIDFPKGLFLVPWQYMIIWRGRGLDAVRIM